MSRILSDIDQRRYQRARGFLADYQRAMHHSSDEVTAAYLRGRDVRVSRKDLCEYRSGGAASWGRAKFERITDAIERYMRSAVQGSKTVTSFKNLSPEEAAELSRELDALEKLRESAELRSPLGLHDLKQHAWRASWLPPSIRPRVLLGLTFTYAVQAADSFYAKRGKRAGRQVLCIEAASKELLMESAVWLKSLLPGGQAATTDQPSPVSPTGETFSELWRGITGYTGHALRSIGLALDDNEMLWTGVRLGADASSERHENFEGFHYNDLWFTDLLLERKHPQAEAVADFVYGKALAAAGPELLPELKLNFAALWASWGAERIQSLRDAIDQRCSKASAARSVGSVVGPALLVLAALLSHCAIWRSPVEGKAAPQGAGVEAIRTEVEGLRLAASTKGHGQTAQCLANSAVAATKGRGGAQQQAAAEFRRDVPTRLV